VDLGLLKKKIRANQYRLTEHADRERENDGIEIRELKRALLGCELLEDYQDDPRGPSSLVLGFDSEGRPVHVVCAIDKNDIVVIITVYIPSKPKWQSPKKRA
jgi:hypothetical protein